VRNVRVADRSTTADHESAATPTVFLIDFGLSYDSRAAEDHAMDLHVFAQSVAGVAADPDALVTAAEDAYREASEQPAPVFERLAAIENRGRYQ
jgi:N6-L-threonylcarbamoyladenine synthase/protein kinase Bud32